MSRHDEHLMDHAYDGIQEFDNPTPGWWHAIFIGTTVFAVMYFIFFSFSPVAWTPQSVLAGKKSAEQKAKFAMLGELKNDEATLVSLMGKPAFMDIASRTFAGVCASCHGKDGGGVVGTNLCDDNYKNVKSITDIYGVITNGAGNGAMPARKSDMSESERVLMAAYVASLRGTTPATAKPAEGEKIAPWPKPVMPATAPPVQ
jgi:cytochrome c oxidase cbb3-type subunit 3